MSKHRSTIMVLGAAVSRDGTPSHTLQRRVNHGARLLTTAGAHEIIVSGGLGEYGHSEADVMASCLLEIGIAENRILSDGAARTTFDSAVFARARMGARSGQLIVVTDSYHRLRSLLVFRAMGLDVIVSCPKEGRGMTSRGKWFSSHIREAIAIPWYVIRIIWFKLWARLVPKA